MDLSIFDLTGQVAIVTGAGRGIGKAIALGLAQAGADVVVAARTTEEIEDTALIIRDLGRKALAIPIDVRDMDQIFGMLDKTLASFSRIDILVNNAGGGVPLNYLLDIKSSEWETAIQLNLNSVFLCTKAIGGEMVKLQSGSIINISSVAGLGPYPRVAAYAAAKAGVISFTKTLAVEWAPHNIRVNAVAPGPVMTPFMRKLAAEDSPRRQAQLKCIPLGRFGTPEDIAGVVIFLASNPSSYVTGETIVVDGGLTTTVFD
jgi:NAD(P)-dependent dehydrogenase (short-subunit alcohol dehydrogenase family)